MSQNPIIKALQDELAKERIECSVKYESKCMCGQDSYKFGHEAATAFWLPLIEKAVEMAEFINSFPSLRELGREDAQSIEQRVMKFLTTLADASGEMNKEDK